MHFNSKNMYQVPNMIIVEKNVSLITFIYANPLIILL